MAARGVIVGASRLESNELLLHRDALGARSLLLSQGERDVVRLMGATALESIRAFGERCERDPILVTAVTKYDAPLHPEVVPWLSNELADYLIAYHMMSQTLAGAVAPTFFGSLPQSTRDLVEMGRSLARFAPEELQGLVAQDPVLAAGTPLLLGGERGALWDTLSCAVIAECNRAQQAAYRARLALQPGGETVLKDYAEAIREGYAEQLARIMTVTLLAELRKCSAEELRLYREIGRQQLATVSVPFSFEELCSGPVRSLAMVGSARGEAPQRAVKRLLSIHQSSWSIAREYIDGGARESASQRSQGAHFDALPHEKQSLVIENLSRVSGLTLAQELARLPEPIFQKLLELCAGDSAEREKIVVDDNVFPSSLSDAEVGANEEVEHAAVEAQPSAVRMLSSEQVATTVARITQIERTLEREDSRALAPLLNQVDGGGLTPDLNHLCAMLRHVAESRQAAVHAVAVGLLASGSHDVAESVAASFGAFDRHALTSMLPRVQAQAFLSAIARRDLLVGQLLSYQEILRRDIPVANTSHTELVESFGTEEYLAIRRLVDQHKRDPADAAFPERGGLVFDTYNRHFLERYLGGGNHLLVHRSSGLKEQGAIDGIFLFGRVGYLPHEARGDFKHIVGALQTPIERTSFSEVLLLDPERAPGAYQRLYLRRLLITSLEGGQYSFGFVHERNVKHREIVKAVGMAELSGAKVFLQDSQTGEEQTYLPVMLDIDRYVPLSRLRI